MAKQKMSERLCFRKIADGSFIPEMTNGDSNGDRYSNWYLLVYDGFLCEGVYKKHNLEYIRQNKNESVMLCASYWQGKEPIPNWTNEELEAFRPCAGVDGWYQDFLQLHDEKITAVYEQEESKEE